MKTTMTIFAMLAVLLVAGCAQQTPQTPEPQGCTEEAKMCEDGSSVARNPSNNCEFDPCPTAGENLEGYDTDRRWVQTSRETCAATTWICPEGTEQFFDDTGCGCEAPEPRIYTSTSADECSTMLFLCTAPLVPFFDSSGCGCGFAWADEYVGAPSIPGQQLPDSKLAAVDCTDPRPQACTREYMPVCGQMEVVCVTEPCDPIMQTFGNKCEACSNERVISYVQGECVDPQENNGGPAGGTMPAYENICTAEQKAAEICTMQYDPVCGDDGETYGNSCSACSSGNIDAWRTGECGATPDDLSVY